MAAQSEDAIERIQAHRRAAVRLEVTIELVQDRSRLPERALDMFSANRILDKSALLAERLDVAFTTAKRAVNRLEALGAGLPCRR